MKKEITLPLNQNPMTDMPLGYKLRSAWFSVRQMAKPVWLSFMILLCTAPFLLYRWNLHHPNEAPILVTTVSSTVRLSLIVISCVVMYHIFHAIRAYFSSNAMIAFLRYKLRRVKVIEKMVQVNSRYEEAREEHLMRIKKNRTKYQNYLNEFIAFQRRTATRRQHSSAKENQRALRELQQRTPVHRKRAEPFSI